MDDMIDVVSDSTVLADCAVYDSALDLVLRLDHIGIAVGSIATARAVYEALGMVVGEEETVAHEEVKTAMIVLGGSRLELLEPLGRDSTIGRFLARRGQGIHHIAVYASDIRAKFAALKAQGVRLVSDSIQTGAGGRGYFFVHPASAGGVLIEIVGDTPAEGERR